MSFRRSPLIWTAVIKWKKLWIFSKINFALKKCYTAVPKSRQRFIHLGRHDSVSGSAHNLSQCQTSLKEHACRWSTHEQALQGLTLKRNLLSSVTHGNRQTDVSTKQTGYSVNRNSSTVNVSRPMEKSFGNEAIKTCFLRSFTDANVSRRMRFFLVDPRRLVDGDEKWQQSYCQQQSYHLCDNTYFDMCNRLHLGCVTCSNFNACIIDSHRRSTALIGERERTYNSPKLNRATINIYGNPLSEFHNAF